MSVETKDLNQRSAEKTDIVARRDERVRGTVRRNHRELEELFRLFRWAKEEWRREVV